MILIVFFFFFMNTCCLAIIVLLVNHHLEIYLNVILYLLKNRWLCGKIPLCFCFAL